MGDSLQNYDFKRGDSKELSTSKIVLRCLMLMLSNMTFSEINNLILYLMLGFSSLF